MFLEEPEEGGVAQAGAKYQRTAMVIDDTGTANSLVSPREQKGVGNETSDLL